MSESLRECEVESVGPDGEFIAKGAWKCGACPEPPITWETCSPSDAIAPRVEYERSLARALAAKQIERHLGGHAE